MARNSARPGRTVTVFFLGLAIAYALVALIGTWKPALGLDLVDSLREEPSLRTYHLLPAVRADLLIKLGRPMEARSELEGRNAS